MSRGLSLASACAATACDYAMDFLEGALPPPPTYEAQCSEFEDIMRFITYGNAAKLKLQNPLAKHFGVVHTCGID